MVVRVVREVRGKQRQVLCPLPFWILLSVVLLMMMVMVMMKMVMILLQVVVMMMVVVVVMLSQKSAGLDRLAALVSLSSFFVCEL